MDVSERWEITILISLFFLHKEMESDHGENADAQIKFPASNSFSFLSQIGPRRMEGERIFFFKKKSVSK